MPWEPGRSGNPSGRPKETDEMRQARELVQKYSVSAIKILAKRMLSQNEAVSIRAAEAILDRGLGKPVTEVEMLKSGIGMQEGKKRGLANEGRD